MPPRFLSPAWLEEAHKVAQASEEFRKHLHHLDASVVTDVADAPGGAITLYYEFADGEFKRLEALKAGAKPPVEPTLTIHTTYETLADINRGKLSVAGAYFKRRFKLEGDKSKAMRFAAAILKYTEVVRHVETEY